MTKTEIEIQL